MDNIKTKKTKKTTVKLDDGRRVVYEKKTRKPRELTAYQKFVKANYDKVRDKPFKERLSHLAKMWKDSKK